MSVKSYHISKYRNQQTITEDDFLAIEEPLEISLSYEVDGKRMQKPVSVTMRTPDHDRELALGFLFTEGIIHRYDEVKQVQTNVFDANKIVVTLQEGKVPAMAQLDRNFYTTSSCGICGKSSIDAIHTKVEFSPQDALAFDEAILFTLQDKLLQQQSAFQKTGGIHASALFDTQGQLLAFQEDVGRHNALDKLIGEAFMQGQIPLQQHVLLLSGRASFELIQKAAMAGIRVVAAVGAPSSLAADAAKQFGMKLYGFVKHDRYNCYT
jgi:FdhD protein